MQQPQFFQSQSAPIEAYAQFVKLQQPDGSWAVAPVAGSASRVTYVQVPGPDGTMVLQQVVQQGNFPNSLNSTLHSSSSIKPFGTNTKEKKGGKDEEASTPWSVNSFNKTTLEEEGDIIYASTTKSDCYFWTRWLWCACMEPMHIVTTKYVETSKWVGCTKESDSKAMDIFDDAELNQSCFQHIWNTCGCCCVDHGTITLLGADRSDWSLEKIHNANETFDRIQKILAKNRKERKRKAEGKGGSKKKGGKKKH